MKEPNKNIVPDEQPASEESEQAPERSAVHEAEALAEHPAYAVLNKKVETVHDDAQKRDQTMEGRLSKQIIDSEGRMNTLTADLKAQTKEFNNEAQKREQAMEGRLSKQIIDSEDRLNTRIADLKVQTNQFNSDAQKREQTMADRLCKQITDSEGRLSEQITELKVQMNQLGKDIAAMNARILNGFIATAIVLVTVLFGAISLLD